MDEVALGLIALRPRPLFVHPCAVERGLRRGDSGLQFGSGAVVEQPGSHRPERGQRRPVGLDPIAWLEDDVDTAS